MPRIRTLCDITGPLSTINRDVESNDTSRHSKYKLLSLSSLSTNNVTQNLKTLQGYFLQML